MTWVVVVVILILALWAITHFYLRGEDLSHYDTPRPPVFAERAEPSEGHKAILEYLDGFGDAGRVKGKALLQLMRERMDAMSDGRDYKSQFIAADADGVPGEWVLAPGADSARRFFYIHGGRVVKIFMQLPGGNISRVHPSVLYGQRSSRHD